MWLLGSVDESMWVCEQKHASQGTVAGKGRMDVLIIT